MRTLLVLNLLLLFRAFHFQQSSFSDCVLNSQSERFGFFFALGNPDQPSAKGFCIGIGGTLAKVGNQKDFLVLEQLIEDRFVTGIQYWIGLEDTGLTGITDGTDPLTFDFVSGVNGTQDKLFYSV